MSIQVIGSIVAIVGGTVALVLTLKEEGFNDPARVFVFGLILAVGLYLAYLNGKKK